MKKPNSNHILIVSLLFFIFLGCSSFSKPQGIVILGSATLFENTSMESIQNKIFYGDTSGLRTELRTMSKEEINFQENRLGATILNWACYNDFEDAVSMLCEYGADPNIAAFDGWTPLIGSVGIARNYNSTKRLLKIGADPCYGFKDDLQMPSMFSPIYLAARNQLEVLKLIQSYGADPNAYDSTLFMPSPLVEACSSGQIENVNFLIFDCHVDYDYRFIKKQDGTYYYITDLLREMDFVLGSKEHSEKMRLVEFLKANGIDYHQAPIPDRIKQKYDSEYISKY